MVGLMAALQGSQAGFEGHGMGSRSEQQKVVAIEAHDGCRVIGRGKPFTESVFAFTLSGRNPLGAVTLLGIGTRGVATRGNQEDNGRSIAPSNFQRL